MGLKTWCGSQSGGYFVHAASNRPALVASAYESFEDIWDPLVTFLRHGARVARGGLITARRAELRGAMQMGRVVGEVGFWDHGEAAFARATKRECCALCDGHARVTPLFTLDARARRYAMSDPHRRRDLVLS